MPSHYFDKEPTNSLMSIKKTAGLRNRQHDIAKRAPDEVRRLGGWGEMASFIDRPTPAEMFKPPSKTPQQQAAEARKSETSFRAAEKGRARLMTTQAGREALTQTAVQARKTAEFSGTLPKHLEERRKRRLRQR